MALIGVFLASFKPKLSSGKMEKKWVLIPIILFLGSGFIDAFLKYTQESSLGENSDTSALFTTFVFFTAFIIGSFVLLINKSPNRWKKENLIAGLILGIINFGSIYFLIETLKVDRFESSIIFPVNNMAVVLLTALLSLLIFKEEFSLRNKIGVAVSIIAISLISFS